MCIAAIAPLIVSIPHTGTDIPADVEAKLVSPWLARKDADWWVERLYDFAADLGATIVRTKISRTVIDCEPRSVGNVALSRRDDDRAVPDDDVRWRAALP